MPPDEPEEELLDRPLVETLLPREPELPLTAELPCDLEPPPEIILAADFNTDELPEDLERVAGT